jgi:hypothetical protein
MQLDIKYLGKNNTDLLRRPDFCIVYKFSALDRYTLLPSDIMYQAVVVHRRCVHMEFYVSSLSSRRILLCADVHALGSYLMLRAAFFSSWVDVM